MSVALTEKVSNLGHRLPTTFNIPALYKPDPSNTKGRENAINSVCEEIDKKVEGKVQRNIETFKADHEALLARLTEVEAKRKQVSSSRFFSGLASILIFQLIIVRPNPIRRLQRSAERS
jgi:hypothetical protein